MKTLVKLIAIISLAVLTGCGKTEEVRPQMIITEDEVKPAKRTTADTCKDLSEMPYESYDLVCEDEEYIAYVEQLVEAGWSFRYINVKYTFNLCGQNCRLYGMTDRSSKTIYLLYGSDVYTEVHEVGHAINYEIGFSDEFVENAVNAQDTEMNYKQGNVEEAIADYYAQSVLGECDTQYLK